MPKKTTTGGASPGSGRLNPPAGCVTVRMYFTGFGDCFLLAFNGDDGEPRYMLIDCGVHDKYEGRKERLEAVAQDIATTCGNKIDIIAVTHEHTDHLYGFLYGKEIFEKMEIGALWLAWTEDPTDILAQELKDHYRKKKLALEAGIRKLEQAGHLHAEILKNLYSFESAASLTESIKSNEEILNALRSWSVKKPGYSEDYLAPGDVPRIIPGVKNVRCFVLGPPKSSEAIISGDVKGEMYFGVRLLTQENAFMSAVLQTGDTTDSGDFPEIRGYPFDEAFSLSPEKAETAIDGFFRVNYGFSDREGDGDAWRRIDTDWLENATDQLALSIGDYTNNTSLVLAFELTDTGRVLLFSGDAQAGNWLSWTRDPALVDGEKILRKTVFYKVGHHGSRNATMKQKGLELMNSDLVAMIPVDEKWAHQRKPRPWIHPDPGVLTELEKKTRGRVLRSDQIPDGDSMKKPDQAGDDEWNAFLQRLEWDKSPQKLWIQYTVS